MYSLLLVPYLTNAVHKTVFGICVDAHDVEGAPITREPDDDSDESGASLKLPGQVFYPVCGKSRPYTQCKCDTYSFFCSSPQCLDRALLVVVLVVHHCLCLPLLPCCNSFLIHRFGALWTVKQLLRFKCTCCVKKIVDAGLVCTNNKKNGVYGSLFFSSQKVDFIVLLYEIFY